VGKGGEVNGSVRMVK